MTRPSREWPCHAWRWCDWRQPQRFRLEIGEGVSCSWHKISKNNIRSLMGIYIYNIKPVIGGAYVYMYCIIYIYIYIFIYFLILYILIYIWAKLCLHILVRGFHLAVWSQVARFCGVKASPAQRVGCGHRTSEELVEKDSVSGAVARCQCVVPYDVVPPLSWLMILTTITRVYARDNLQANF